MLEKYLRMIGLSRERAGEPEAAPPEPPAGTAPGSLAEVVPPAEPGAARARVSDPLIDTGEVSTEGVFTEVLKVKTHGERTDPKELRQRFIGRLPILDRGQRIVGYELMLRNKQAAESADEALQLLRDEMLVRSIIALDIDKLLQDKLAMITVSPATLLNPLLDRLPEKGVVLAVRDAAGLSDDALRRLKELRVRGHAVALDDYGGAAGERLLAVADYVGFDVARHDALEISQRVESLQARGVNRLMARNLKTREDLEASRNLPFNFFQGYYFVVPHPEVGARIDNERSTVMELLNMVRERAEIPALEGVFKRDPVLSYNLLRYINSPGCGMMQTIRSIAHALIILGYDQLYRWLTLLLFTSGRLDERSRALLKNALVRGRFTEILGERALKPADREGAFIVGVFSLLDALLNVPLEKALQQLSLPDAVLAALLRREGIYAPFLELALACERAGQDRIEELATRCGLDADAVNVAHLQALIWAEEVEK